MNFDQRPRVGGGYLAFTPANVRVVREIPPESLRLLYLKGVCTYAFVLNLHPYPPPRILQEVLELGEGGSTDSGWGESSSSSGEHKSSSHDDESDERASGSSGCEGGHSGQNGDNPSSVSTPELAIFLFQGGVDGSSRSGSDGGDEAKEKGGSSAVLQEQKEDSTELSSRLGLSADERPFPDFEYSRSGLRETREAGERASSRECEHAGGSGRGGDEDAGAVESGGRDPNPHRQEPVVVVVNGTDNEENQESGAKSSSLTSELRGVDFVLNSLN